jgi:hypothetical protein
MIEALVRSWESLPWLLQFVLGFWFNVIFLRGIVANDINGWLQEKGIMKRGFIHPSMEFMKKVISGTERKSAIFAHYQAGHRASSVLECSEGQCGVFRTA